MEIIQIWLVGKEAELAERTEDDVLIEEFGADLKKCLLYFEIFVKDRNKLLLFKLKTISQYRY